jgi:NAD(P)-dependent dehydrogenase (short-subunit alcohol dehydrogenase family)
VELNGRVVCVTGAASGIGRALAERFATEPVRAVVVADLDAAGAEEVAGALGVEAMAVACDVSDPAENVMLVDRAHARYGALDIFCANAGVAWGTQLEDDPAQFSRVMDINLGAHVHAARALIPGWLARGEGYFVSTASAAGLLSQIGDVAYAVSKRAAVGFAEWLAITYGAQGVRVSCLCPMGVDTPLGGFSAPPGRSPSLAARSVMAAGEILEPAQVAELVIAAIAEERFLILPHPEVAEFVRRKAEDPARWLAGMQRLQAQVQAEGA